jgi:hypothetical protein
VYFGIGSNGFPDRDDPVRREGDFHRAADFVNGLLVGMDHPSNPAVPFCRGPPHELELEDAGDERRTCIVAISIHFKGSAKSLIGHGFEDGLQLALILSTLLVSSRK